MLSPASAGSKGTAAAISFNNHSGSTPKRSKSSTLITSENESDSGSDTPFLTRSEKSDLAYFQREEGEDAARLAQTIAETPYLHSQTPDSVVANLAVGGQNLRKALLEGLHSLQEQKDRIDGLIAITLGFVAPPLLAIEPIALHEHLVLNRRSTFEIVTDMLHRGTNITVVPYLEMEDILKREASYREDEAEMSVKREQWRFMSEYKQRQMLFKSYPSN